MSRCPRHVGATPVADGRARRSAESRARIKRAMFELLRAGAVDPGVARVARAAGVGERTVFRHFREIDSLYREMAQELEATLLPVLRAPYAGADWRARLAEQIARRAQVFEVAMPVKIASGLQRHRSAFLARDHQRHLRLERDTLATVLPRQIAADATLFRALALALGFQAWAALRRDQKLPVAQALAVVRRTVEGLVGALP